MKVEHEEIIDSNSYYSISSRMAAVIEETLHRGRKIVATVICADNHRFYGSIFWTEGQ